MDIEKRVETLVSDLAKEVLLFIKSQEPSFNDRWVPASHIKKSLNLNFVAVPKNNNKQHGTKGWFFAIIARILEDKNLVQYQKVNQRAYYRSI